MKKNNRVVILGSKSFIASELIKKLKKNNDNYLLINRNKINFKKENSTNKLIKILRKKDIIVFIAAVAPVKNFKMLNENLVICKHISSAIKKKGIKHLLYVSSDAVYSDTKNLITEKSQTEPENLHGFMHLMRENILKLLNIRLCIVRPTLVYGTADPHNGYGPNKFIRLAQLKKNILIFGKGEEKRDHIHVKDVGLVLYNLIKIKYEGIVNIVTGNAISFLTIALKIKNTYKIKLKYLKRIGPMPHNGYRAFNNKLIKKIFPKVEFDNILDWVEKKEKYK